MQQSRLLVFLSLVLLAFMPVFGYAQLGVDVMRGTLIVQELSQEWDNWEAIPDFNPIAYGTGPTGDRVQIGTAKGFHADTAKYGHVDLIRVYAFDTQDLVYTKVASRSFTVFVVNTADGKTVIPKDGNVTVEVDAQGVATSFAVAYELIDGSKGTRIFTNPKAKLKI